MMSAEEKAKQCLVKISGQLWEKGDPSKPSGLNEIAKSVIAAAIREAVEERHKEWVDRESGMLVLDSNKTEADSRKAALEEARNLVRPVCRDCAAVIQILMDADADKRKDGDDER